MKLVNSGAMALIDKRAQEEYHVPSLLLMENAGLKACRIVQDRIWQGEDTTGELVFLAGKGNNGGDALVMARQLFLAGFKHQSIILVSGRPAEGSDPYINLEICKKYQLKVIDYRTDPKEALSRIERARWFFDGIAGTGIRGELKAELAQLVQRINQAPGRVIAIDVPSGLGDGFRKGFPCVQAAHTVTMGLPKECLYLPYGRAFCGKIHLVRLGFPPGLVQDPAIPGELLQAAELAALNPRLPAQSYKNSRGHLAVFAGSPGTTGAAWLCATAAARSKAGLVSLMASREIYPLVAGSYTSVMVKPRPEAPPLPRADSFSALLVGPGWGTGPQEREWLEYLLGLQLPLVIDADGLSLLGELAGQGELDLESRAILTPHPGEFSRLSGVAVDTVLHEPVQQALALSRRFRAVVVLKGHVTCIASPHGEYSLLDGMNPAMGTAGAGDVLAGLAAAALGLGLPAYAAARLAVLLHSLAGEEAYRERGWFLAEDLLPYLSRLLMD